MFSDRVVSQKYQGTMPYMAELLAIYLAIGNARSQRLHIVTDCKSVVSRVNCALQYGKLAAKGRVGGAVLIAISRTVTAKRLHVSLEWTKAHVGTTGNELADTYAKRCRQSSSPPVGGVVCGDTTTLLIQNGLPLVGVPQIGPSTPPATLNFSWHRYTPLSRLAWSWQHGYISTNHRAYFNKAVSVCDLCSCSHSQTLHDGLVHCSALEQWRTTIFSGYPRHWIKTISQWFSPLRQGEADCKAAIRFLVPSSLQATLQLTSKEVEEELKRTTSQQAAAAMAVLQAARSLWG